jgi:hypothetical protein
MVVSVLIVMMQTQSDFAFGFKSFDKDSINPEVLVLLLLLTVFASFSGALQLLRWVS